MYSDFSEEAKKVLINAKVEMMNLKHPYIGSEHLLLSILKEKNDVSKELNKIGLTYDIFKEEIINIIGMGTKKSDCFLYTPLLKRVIENSTELARDNKVTIQNLFTSLLEEGEGVAIRIMLGLSIDLDDLYETFCYIIKTKANNKELLLETLGTDFTKVADFDPVIGREEEIKQVIEILCRRKKNNPILVGRAGVGKTAIVEELSRMIKDNEVPQKLKNKRIINLDMSSIVAGTKYRGEFEDRVNKILKEASENDDIILFIDEIHTIVGAGGAEGAIDASNIFKPALARGEIRLIGATTTDEYKKTIEQDKALDRRFQKVEIKEPTKEELFKILKNVSTNYSKYHKTKIADEILNEIIDFSNKYIHNRYQPDKAIDILDEVCAYVSIKESSINKKINKLNKDLNKISKLKKECIINSDYKCATNYKKMENELSNKINNLELKLNNNDKNIEYDDVIKIISRKCNIPIYQLKDYDDKIIKKEIELKKNIIGHNKEIDEVINYLKQIKLGYKDIDKPFSLLFVGPSGVGKTLLAKSISKDIFTNVLKLDMSEYSEAYSVNKLIGSPSGYVGYSDNKNLFEKIKDNPFSLIILDEVEKAHPSVINLFYQILDEGYIRDSKGEKIYFNNSLIIMTSNVGYLDKPIGFNKNVNNNLKENFSIPFINRIDNIIKFNYLNLNDMKIILDLELKKLKKKYKNINIIIKEEVKKDIIDKSNYKIYGARKLSKIIKKEIEPIIIDKILEKRKTVTIKKIEKVIN